MSVTAQPTPALIFDTLGAYQRTAALKAAVDLEIFTAIDEGAATAAEIARRCGASERGTRILCDFLTIAGLLSKTDERYGLTPEAAAFLSKKSRMYLGSVCEFLVSPEIVRNFEDLTSTVRRGTVA